MNFLCHLCEADFDRKRKLKNLLEDISDMRDEDNSTDEETLLKYSFCSEPLQTKSVIKRQAELEDNDKKYNKRDISEQKTFPTPFSVNQGGGNSFSVCSSTLATYHMFLLFFYRFFHICCSHFLKSFNNINKVLCYIHFLG